MSKIIAIYCPVSYFSDDAVYIYLGNGMGSLISSNFQRIYFLEGVWSLQEISTQQLKVYRQSIIRGQSSHRYNVCSDIGENVGI